jgi:hypothetical protein
VNVGSFVTYDDEDIETTSFIGEVVEPTQEELNQVADRNATTVDGPIGPENGDIMVAWNDGYGGSDRSWEHPSYLVEVDIANV